MYFFAEFPSFDVSKDDRRRRQNIPDNFPEIPCFCPQLEFTQHNKDLPSHRICESVLVLAR